MAFRGVWLKWWRLSTLRRGQTHLPESRTMSVSLTSYTVQPSTRLAKAQRLKDLDDENAIYQTAAHLDARLQYLMQSAAHLRPLNILACFPSHLAEDASNGNIKRKRECLKLELWIILQRSERVERDYHLACDPAGGSFHCSPFLESCIFPLGWRRSLNGGGGWWAGGGRAEVGWGGGEEWD